MGTQALTALRFSKITLRSVARSRTIGNLENGSSFTGCSRLSISAEQAMRAFPLISMAQEPQTSSRQLESKETGVVFLASRVTGFSAMSRKQMMMFIDGRHGSANSSQRAASFGLAWRLMRRTTCFVSAMPTSFCGVITTRARRNLRDIDGLVGQLNFVVHPFCAGGLKPVGVIAFREIGLVVRAAGLVAIVGPDGDDTGQN